MEIDPLRDEAEDYARALADAGVSTELHRAEGLFHGAFTMTALIPRAAELHERVGRFLSRAFQSDRNFSSFRVALNSTHAGWIERTED